MLVDLPSFPVIAAQGVGGTQPWSMIVEGTPDVTISGTPSVEISGIPTVSQGVGGTIPWSVIVEGTSDVAISGTPTVAVSGTPTVNQGVGAGGTSEWLVYMTRTVTVSPSVRTFVKTTKNITSGYVSEIGLSTSSARTFWRILNPGVSTEPLYFDDCGSASTSSMVLQPGEIYESKQVTAANAINVMAPSTGHSYVIWYC